MPEEFLSSLAVGDHLRVPDRRMLDYRAKRFLNIETAGETCAYFAPRGVVVIYTHHSLPSTHSKLNIDLCDLCLLASALFALIFLCLFFISTVKTF